MPDTWSLPHNRGLPKRLKERNGRLEIPLYGTRVISHALLESPKIHAKRGVKPTAEVIAQVTVTVAEGSEWDANPMRQNVDPNVPAGWGIILIRDSSDPFAEDNSRIFHTVRTPLAAGTTRIVAPLDPAQWIQMWGKSMDRRKPLWRNIWQDETRLGICFGGQFYGHGVAVPVGSALITIDQLTFRY